MNIDHGLMAGQVLQRNSKNFGEARLEGTATANGLVEARILKGTKPLKGWNWKKAGKAAAGQFKARIGQIPCGGPYTVSLRIAAESKTFEKIDISGIFVGDVWFMAGQSNMQGVGNMNRAAKPHPMVRCFFMRDEWDLAKDPLHQLGEAVDFFHNNGNRCTPEQAAIERKTALKGVGVGVFFGIEMYKRTGVPQGLVSCAHGGTSMAQWSPDLKDQGGKSLYGAMLRRFNKLGQPLRGILWYQGESDAGAAPAAVYTQKMKELVAATRVDFRLPALPWIIVQIGRVIGDDSWSPVEWNNIQDQERRLVDEIKNLEVVPAIDLDLDDLIHIASEGHAILGKRMAHMADRLALGNKKEAGSIRVVSICKKIQKDMTNPRKEWFEVTFKNVVGELRSNGRPSGFTFFNAVEKPLNLIYKATLEGNKAILETIPSASEALSLSYGNGLNPYCNITDARGMLLPVFGPLPTGIYPASSFFINWQVAGPLTDRNIKTAPLPEQGLQWHAPHSTSENLAMPQDVNAAPRPGIFYLRTAIIVPKACKLKLAMGADSPYRVWINNRETVRNLKATNPCITDEYVCLVEFQAGRNEIMVAFDGRAGKGWGIKMRCLAKGKGETPTPDSIVEEKA